LLPGISALALLGFERELDECRAQRFDLILDGGTYVISRYNGAEPPRRGDRLKAGDPGSHHQHASRSDCAGRGHHHRKEFAEARGRYQDRLVTRCRCLRRQSIHRLGPRDARNQLQAERGDATLGERRDYVALCGRLEKADQHSSLLQKLQLAGGWRLHLEDDVSILQKRGRAFYYLDAGGLVSLVWDECVRACAFLDADL